ncbi:hypothetical protein Tco_0813391 [Tanacetum coccineum]
MTSRTPPTQGFEILPLAPRDLVFSTPLSSPIEPHSYLTSMEELHPKRSNPPPPPPSQGFNQTLPQHTSIDFEPFFPPINLSRSRMSAQPEALMREDSPIYAYEIKLRGSPIASISPLKKILY